MSDIQYLQTNVTFSMLKVNIKNEFMCYLA